MKNVIVTVVFLCLLNVNGLFAQQVDVISPNGGETLTVGSSFTIQWASYGSSFLVDLYYSTDGGTTWVFINDNLPHTGTYTWTVPNVSSSTCLVKADAQYYVDQSNSYFSIVVGNTLTLTYPNGGEVLSSGTLQNVSWTFTGSISYLALYYSTDLGSNWTYIDVVSNTSPYQWMVPSVNTATAMFKIENTSNPVEFDVSDAPFQIGVVASNPVTVTYPNGGEVLQGSGSYDITWSSDGSITWLDLYYSTDGGSNWVFIADHETNDGSYTWTAPNIATQNAKIMITEFSNSNIYDISDSAFTINAVANSVTVISPNGAEFLSIGSTYNITWSSTGSISYVEIWYSTDGGMLWYYIDDYSFNDGSYQWAVPNIPTVNALIKINEVFNTSVSDVSDNVFAIGTISNSVTVTSPNGGEVLTPGTSHYITWSSTGSISDVEIYLSVDSGSTWSYIDDYAFNDGIYEWTVPNVSTSTALLRINDVSNASTYDISDATFVISSVISSGITVLTPNGGDTLYGGSNYTITWSWAGTFIYAEIYYSTDGGTTWAYVDDFTANDGIYVWNVINTQTNNALIKVQEAGNASVFDVSDSPFTINAITNSIYVSSPNGGEVLTSGTTHNITWSANGIINYVEIWWSDDGGMSWMYIDDYAFNDGVFEWYVPSLITTTALVKINDVANASTVDISNAVFEITAPVTSPIVITYPNGGETLSGGSTYDITWNSNGTVTWLDLYYSTNNGSTWTFIADHEANDGTFTWNAANVTTSNALIMITEFSNTNIYDISDAVFSINAVPNTVTVISPNGGETLYSGTVHNITWSTTGTFTYGAVEVWYSTDGGNIWTYIDDYAQNDGQLEWTVPNIASVNALIKINEVYNTSVVDVSDAAFEINPVAPSSITVLTPNGFENLNGGDSYNITWETTGNISYVEIWYSTNGGYNWTYIDDYSPNDSSYTWNVVNTNTSSALIKINDVANSAFADVSDNMFTINYVPDNITVLSPNGGELLSAGATYDITWSSTGSISYVEIWYSLNGGALWTYIDDYTINDGSYLWTVPNVTTVNALVRIDGYNTSVMDVSNSAFEITQVISNPVTVTYPNGGESLSGGSTYDITWSSDGSITWLDLYYSTDGGSNWIFIADHEANDGSYNWTAPNITTQNAKIMITEFSNTNIYDLSDSTFSITAVMNSVTVISPNGGEVLIGGSTHSITWTTTGTINFLEIWYSPDGGIDWFYIDDYAWNDSLLEWTVPNINTTSALVKINELYNTLVVDVSNAVFTINAIPNTITILTPNGGENLSVGATHDITWSSTGTISYVEIWYSANNGSSWTYIDDYSVNDGLYEWTVPNTITTTALVKINDLNNTSVVDVSDSTFEIAAASPFTVITPNGGEVLTGGNTYTITWSTSGYSGNYVGILYSTDGGNTWATVDDFKFNNGFKEWTVANVSTTNALIKVHEVFNAANGDVSDAPFTINAVINTITITSPNGGEILTGGSTHNITWTSTGLINYVEIWYSTDNGSVWNYIDDYSANDGLYEWTVTNVSTVNALVKINEVYNISVLDVSDSTFEINAVVPITIISPNGGETIAGGSTYDITWISDGSFSYVDLYYSTDGGNNWAIIADHEDNDSIYSWIVPNVTTSTAMIAITEFNSSGTYDFSDANFTINAVANSITVLSPNGGETWTAGTTQDVTWSSTGAINYVEIWYSSDGGQVWTYIDDYSPNDGLYEWSVPNISTVNALIKINEVFNTSIVDVSDANFEINQVVSNPVTIITPNGGETLTGGSPYNITWTSDQTITWLDLYYSTDGGSTWLFIADHEANDSSYIWMVPNISSTNALIKITEFSNASTFDVSDAVFSINAIANSVTVVSPNGGEVWVAGSSQDITWTSTGSINYVEIWYSTNGGTNWTYIDDYSANDGLYEWTVPSFATVNALIKINEVFNASVFDVSDSAFEITVPTPNTITISTPNGGENLSAGSNYFITWTNTGQIDYVEIWFSSDGGSNWSYIDDHAFNAGIHEWTVPNTITTNALIRINEFGNSSVVDVCDSIFEISTAVNSLTLTHPNGGELLTISATYYVVWESIGNISHVDLSYSTDSGATWDSIASNVPNNGLHSWEIPNAPTSNALVKVVETGNSSVADESDSTFTITSSFYSSLMILAPNGGEVITGGSTYEITWWSVGMIPYVSLFYSVDNGINWIVIDTYLGSNGPYSWNVPNINSQDVLIRIENQFDPSMGDNSNNVFSISSPSGNSLTVTQPDGGEVLTTGSSVDITWTSTGSISNVDILYSIDGGSNWSVITTNTVNDGIYTWQVPNDTTSTALISIRDAGNVNTYDESNSTFTITQTGPSITITSPNGGEVWPGGSSQNITWTSNGSITHVQVAYSLNGGQTWIYLSVYQQNSGSHSWTVPYVNSSTALVKVNDVFNQNTADISNNTFVIGSLPAQITILSPNGGETWAGGSTQNISWTSIGAIPYVEIWYSPDGGLVWTYLDDYAVNDGLFEWTVPNISTTTAVVKINDVSYPYVVDYSDAAFEISSSVNNTVTVLAPNGGEVLAGGTNYDILWTSTGTIAEVDIYYSLDGGSNWSFVANNTNNDGSYTWLVSNLPTTNALIAIIDSNNPIITDTSDSSFTISAIAQTISVISPNGGEVWEIGSTQNITWSTTGQVLYVKIWYSTDGGSNWTNIAPYNPNSGSYAWTVPNATTTDALIKITDVNNISVADVSDTTFEIGATLPNSITVLTPNGGEILNGGSYLNITWSSTGTISYVEIWYSTNGGTSWTYVDDYSPNDGQHGWTVANVNTSDALIKIHEVFAPSNGDTSDSTFTINAVTNSVTVISPNGGEVLTAGTTHIIQWSWTGTFTYGAVEIWYSTDGGNLWNYINDYATNIGQYAWTVPNIPSSSALIKINEVYNSTVVDISDSTFEIMGAAPNSITVLTPNGGEVLTGGSNYDITWSSTGSINYVEIYYSTNGGSTWTYIDDYSPNDGIHTWNVENVSTTNALIKIHEIFNSTVNDLSDSTFTINAVPNSLTLVAPNGGETWTVGSIQDITWSSTGTVNYVDISLSIDSGINWFYIGEYQYNDGHFEWTVLNNPSTTAMIKINDVYNTTVTDVGDSIFTIQPATPASITINYPNGGEVITANDWSYISWTSSGITGNVMIHYSIDNGTNWVMLNDNVQNSGGYQYIVPNVSNTACLIKVQELGGSTILDVSDSVFTIQPAIPASITINYPNGGEIITNNDWSYISWTSSGITGNVMIHYSIDNGTNWVMLNDNVQNSGGYQYIVPNVTSTACLIKVQELGGSTVLDVSDSVFTIGPSVTNSLTVLTPNGGDTLIEGNVYNITWSSTGTIGLIDLYYSSDNGVTWNFIDDNLQNTGPYAWTVPSVASTQCLLKVQSGAVEDLSDAVFTIQILTVPGTGLLLAQYYFNEGTANDDIGNIDGQRNDLELVSDRFGCPNHAFKFGPSNGYINLGDTLDEVFAAPDSSFAFSVWIKKTSNFAYGTIIAKNAGNYCGLNGRQFNLKLQSNGKIRFVFASTLNYQILETMETIGTVSDLNWHHVAFNYDGSINTSGPDRVEIYIDNQLQSVNTVNSYGNMSDIQNGDAQLSIGSEVDATGGSCGTNFFNGSLDDIRIYAGNLSSSDVAGLFNETLTCPVNALTITSPNSSISFNEGASHTITWNSIGQVSNVDLYYSSDGGDNFTSIATNISNTGIYAWTVPSVASANCLIRIEETGNPVVIDESDATFTIVQNTLTVDVPNGGQNWDGLSNHNIWWIKTGNIPMVDLYYTIDNGTTWTLIADNLSSTYHTWSVPNVSSVMCKIKVVQTGNPAVADESDNTFTINYIAPELTLTSHNSGQTLNGGNNSYIYWQSAGGVGDINIYFYEDSSPFWNLLSGNESNDGSYAWTVPNINAYNCLIKIEDASDPSVKDSSDMVFTISEAHSITVLHPNGGGLMETNSSDSITWAWTGLFDYVDIYYSHNGGSNWYLIEELVVNNGFYNWSPTFASTNFLIKVEESGNSSIYDISDQVFEVGPTGTIDLLYPDGGEIFLGATLDSVLWDANGNVNFNDVKFSSDGGATWSWEGDAPAEWESVGWAIPNISSTTCLIAYGGDTSSTYFTIVENLDSIMVLSPNGGEVYEGGDTLIVTWDTTGNSNAPLIDFYFKLTYNFQLRATVPNTGSMEYVLPNVTTTTAEVRLQLNGTTIYDDSDGPFSVTEIAISVVSPNGGEVLTGNDSTVISWTQTGTFDGVKLSYTPDLGSHWVDIAESVSGNSYMWTIPNISSANCMVKVARVGVIADQSNAVFTINNVPLPPWDSIAMINVDDLQYHQWLSENIGFYCADQYPGGVFSYPFHTIQKTLNGGQTWTTTNPITTSYQGLPLAIYGTWFFDANNGIAMGHPMQWASHDWETWITSDAGVTWTQRSDTVFADFSTYSDFGMKDFEMLDVNVGYANARIYNITLGTLQDVIFLTTDGGLTWNVRPTPDLTFHHGGEFLNASTGFVVGNDYVYKTIDGGVSWTNSYQVQGNGVPKDLDFVSDSVGYVMTRLLNGSWFNIIRTTDQGLTWDVRNVPPISYTDVGEMFFLSQDVGLISSTANPGVSGIWRTSNGALTWETDSLVSTVPVQKSDKAVDIVMVSETINYALLSGMIIKAGAVPPASSYNNTWTYSNTGNSHTILIPNSAPVTIDGTQLAIGDFIGVFYDSLGNQACAGFMEWTAQIQSITAWGDDPLTSEPDGFATGETFQWKVWRAIDGLGFDATATYIQPPTMPNTGTFVTNGMSGLISLDAIIEEYQSIDLPQGWSIFSSYINPFEANFDSICAPIITEVIIAKDADGQVYWPQWNVNLIGDLLIGDGYQIKLVTMQTMTLVGNAVQPENTLVTIDQGWSIMGYLRQSEAPINIMLSPVVSEIIIVKNGAGQIYWPQWGVNLIGNMVPGEGYQVNMITQQSLLFPANSILFTKFVMNQFQSVHFNTNKNTGNNMSLGLMTSEFKIGSEIGVFSQSGLLVGSGVVTGNFTALTLWGDDETTPEIDGLHRGEEFIIKLWNGEECILEHNSWLQGDGTYKKNDIAIPDKLDVVADNFITLISYPNPFKDVTTIEFTIPADGYVVIKLYNSTGMLLEVISDRAYPAGKHEVQLNVGDVSVGNYFIRLESNGQAINNAIQIVK